VIYPNLSCIMVSARLEVISFIFELEKGVTVL
jgi:hypothetical protein